MAEEGKEGWFIYGFVARGTVVLAEYTEYTGNFPAIAAQCLQKLPSSNKLSTYACDAHTFIFLVHNGYGIFPISIVSCRDIRLIYSYAFSMTHGGSSMWFLEVACLMSEGLCVN